MNLQYQLQFINIVQYAAYAIYLLYNYIYAIK